MTDQPPPIDQAAFLKADHARRYTSDAGSQDRVPTSQLEPLLQNLDAQGFVVVPDLLTADEVEDLRRDLLPRFGPLGRNAFEGQRTQRLYSILAQSTCCDRLVEHPVVLGVLDRLLQPNYLLSQLQGIRILPGEQPQLWHHDDSLYPFPRPRPALSVAAMWAIDPFTRVNGATALVPGSHRWPADRVPDDAEVVQAEMSPGSCAIFLGTTWHRGEANRSASPRFGITVQYCEPYLRPQESFALSVSRERARESSSHLQRMLGYSIHPPFLGAVQGMHPKRLLAS